MKKRYLIIIMLLSIVTVIYIINLFDTRSDIEFTFEISKVTIADNVVQELKLIDVFTSKSNLKRIPKSDNISAELFDNANLTIYTINQLEMKGEDINDATYFACIETMERCYIAEIDSEIKFQNLIDNNESQDILVDFILKQERIMILSSSLYEYLEQ